MPSQLAELKTNDIAFFTSVKEHRALQVTLANHGFDRLHVYGSQHNAVFVITQVAWDLPSRSNHTTRLNIHFAARKRNQLRIEIGLNPYIGYVEQKPHLLDELQPVLRR